MYYGWISAEYFENGIRSVPFEVKIHDFTFWACKWMEKNICSFNIPSWNWNTKFANELWLSVQMFAISVNFHFICSLYVSWIEIFLHAMRLEWHHRTHTQQNKTTVSNLSQVGCDCGASGRNGVITYEWHITSKQSRVFEKI